MQKALLFSTAASLALLMPSNVHAAGQAAQSDQGSPAEQTDAGEQTTGSGDIIVTARRRAEDASKVPLAVTAFSGEALEEKNVTNLFDLTKIAPGINIQIGNSRTQPWLTIRGQSKGTSANIQPGVIVYVNEVPLSNMGVLIPTYDLTNIQVLKGPQGTLFGRNAIGGAVLVATQAPTREVEGYAKVDVGSHSYKQFEAAVNVPVLEDRMALRLATQINYDGGSYRGQLVSPYTINPATNLATPGTIRPMSRNLDATASQAVRASLWVEPVDGLTNTTVVEYSKTRGLAAAFPTEFFSSGFNGGTPQFQYLPRSVLLTNLGPVVGQNVLNLARCGDATATPSTPLLNCDWRAAQAYAQASNGRSGVVNSDPWQTRSILFSVTNTTALDLGSATLKNIFGYRSTDVYQNSDVDGTGLPIVTTAAQIQVAQITNELQLSGSLLNGALDYTVGGFYYHEAPNGPAGTQTADVNVLFGLSHSLGASHVTNDSRALYGQLDYALDWLVEGLTVTAGLRQTWDTVQACASNVAYSPLANQMYVLGPDSPIITDQEQCESGSLTRADFPGSTSVSTSNLPKTDFRKLTYTVGANWQITPQAMVYVVHRRGYRAGSFTVPLVTDPFLSHLQAFGPQTLTDFEVGTKLRWRSGSVQGSLDLAAFTGKDKGNQLSVSTSGLAGGVCVPEAITASRPANCTSAGNASIPAGTPGVLVSTPALGTILNAGELTIRGFEAQGSITPLEGVTIGGGVAYLDYEVDRITIDPAIIALLTAAGRTGGLPRTIVLNQQPRWAYNLDLDVTLPNRILDSVVSLSANFKRSGSVQQADNIVPAYSVLDARLTFADIGQTGVDVAFWARNLTNNYYFNGGIGGAATGNYSYSVAPPRTVGVSLKYSFGS